ncbi:hypothetical protein GCM10023219_22160 [Stakelama sediminis]|uniref:Uncharacterized protein n=1 Tax=Stakelama sediminis TaxID=463200 RepID=A0A840YZD5_9SPHN|nr:hypothetical protein [Stakelama sediminis]MBB5719171.1 hypothetical protein [Stakelama sediminis]
MERLALEHADIVDLDTPLAMPGTLATAQGDSDPLYELIVSIAQSMLPTAI